MFFTDLTPAYIDYQLSRNKPRSVRNVKQALKVLNAHFGERKVDVLTESDLSSFITKRRKQVKDVSVNRDLTILKGLLRFSIAEGNLQKLPFRIRMLKVDRKRELPVLSKEQLRSLVDAAKGPFRGILLLASSTGMRTGEILNLQWKDIGWEDGSVSITAKKNWSPKSL